MYIEGYAMKKNEKELMQQYSERYKEIAHHQQTIDMERTPAYGKGCFSGTLRTHEEKPALIFGRNGMGEIGAPTQPDRVATHDETLAVVTFANVESLDVVAGKLRILREKMVANK